MKIIFIIYNIFEVKSGVSNKYIHFFDFLNKKDIDFIILTTFNQPIKKIFLFIIILNLKV